MMVSNREYRRFTVLTLLTLTLLTFAEVIIPVQGTQLIRFDFSTRADTGGGTQCAGGGGSLSWTHTIGNGPRRFILIGINSADHISIASVTVNGISATRIRQDFQVGGPDGEVWYLVDPPSGPQTVTVNPSAPSIISAGSVSYFNVSPDNPIDTSAASTFASTASLLNSITTRNKNELLVSNVATQTCNTLVTFTQNSGQTERWSTPFGPPIDYGDDLLATSPGHQSLSLTASHIQFGVYQTVALNSCHTFGPS